MMKEIIKIYLKTITNSRIKYTCKSMEGVKSNKRNHLDFMKKSRLFKKPLKKITEKEISKEYIHVKMFITTNLFSKKIVILIDC